MNGKKKRIRRHVIACAIGLALCLVVEYLSYRGVISERTQRLIYESIILLDVVFIVVDRSLLRAQIKKLSAMRELDPDRFLVKTEPMLKSILWRRFRPVLHEARAYFYAEKKEWNLALEEMQKVDTKAMPGNQGLFWGNYAQMHFEMGQPEKACALIDEHREEIGSLQGSADYRGLVDPLWVRYAMAKQDPNAKSLLEETILAWETDRDLEPKKRESVLQELEMLKENLEKTNLPK